MSQIFFFENLAKSLVRVTPKPRAWPSPSAASEEERMAHQRRPSPYVPIRPAQRRQLVKKNAASQFFLFFYFFEGIARQRILKYVNALYLRRREALA